MGGAFGHIAHPYEDVELTIDDLIRMFEDVASGRVRLFEKFDGINLMFKTTRGELRLARSVNELKSGGFVVDELIGRFPRSEHVGVELHKAMTALADVLVQSEHVDDDGWCSLDVLSRPLKNVVAYDIDAIVVHPIRVAEGHEWGVYSYMDAYDKTYDGWQIVGPQVVHPAATSTLERHIDALRSSWSGSMTLGEVYAQNIVNELRQKGFPAPVAKPVAARIVGAPGHLTLTELKRGLIAADARLISGFVNDPRTLRAARQSIEDVVCRFTADLLSGVHSALVRDGARELRRIRAAYFQKLIALMGSGERRYDVDVDRAGELENLDTTIEGVVYEWNGKLYKLTGYFRYVNQVMGFDRF